MYDFSFDILLKLNLTSNRIFPILPNILNLTTMPKIAIIKTGGKQYVVKAKDRIKVEKLPVQEGDKVDFDVLLTADESGQDVKLGAPLVKGAQVGAKVLEQGRDKKVRVVHYKNKTRYHKVYGHRQPYSKVEIISIG